MKKIIFTWIFASSMLLSLNGQNNQMRSNNGYTLTPLIAGKLSTYCNSNLNMYAFVLESVKRHIGKDYELSYYAKIIDSFHENIYYAEQVISDLYELNGNDAYFTLRQFLYPNEIKLTEQLWANERLKREKARKKWQEAEIKRQEDERVAEIKRQETERAAEIERQKTERARKIEEERIKEELINDFLEERETKIYDINTYNIGLYEANKAKILEVIDQVVRKHYPPNFNIDILDNVKIHYDGQTSHNVVITGVKADQNLISNEIKEALDNLQLTPASVIVAGTNTEFNVISAGEFNINYSITIEQEDLKLKKRNSGVELLKGDLNFYNSEKQYINGVLSKKGKYDISVQRTNVCGKISKNTTTNDYRKPIDNVMIGYIGSRTAPVGLMVGFNGINYTKHWGVYISGKTSIQGAVDRTHFDYITTHPKKKGYLRIGITAGGLLSITKYGYLYGGIGYGKCSVRYSNDQIGRDWNAESVANYYESAPIKGIETELGVIIRPIKFLGISAGYSAIPNFFGDNSKYFGDVNFGLLIFL